LTASEGRRFGLVVGAAFLVLGAIAWWRGHPLTTTVFAALGASLALAGLVIPTRLGPVEAAWMKMAHAISRVTTPIVMAVIYYVVISPVGYLRRAFGGNPLVHEKTTNGFWRTRSTASSNMERQF
jgi:hypothetical protein